MNEFWLGIIFACSGLISPADCGWGNAYEIIRPDTPYRSQEECEDRLRHRLQAIELVGDRNTRIECDKR